MRPFGPVRARDATVADLGRLYAVRGEALAGVAARLCGEDDAEDFMQDAFVRALAQIETARQLLAPRDLDVQRDGRREPPSTAIDDDVIVRARR
jgi:hypothetical protein